MVPLREGLFISGTLHTNPLREYEGFFLDGTSYLFRYECYPNGYILQVLLRSAQENPEAEPIIKQCSQRRGGEGGQRNLIADQCQLEVVGDRRLEGQYPQTTDRGAWVR